MNNPWLTQQWNEAVILWGEGVDRRLEMIERQLVPIERIPDGMTYSQEPLYTLVEALGFEADGSRPISIENRQTEKLVSLFGVTHHEGQMPDHLKGTLG